jgi:hypothetical protein
MQHNDDVHISYRRQLKRVDSLDPQPAELSKSTPIIMIFYTLLENNERIRIPECRQLMMIFNTHKKYFATSRNPLETLSLRPVE